MDFRDHLFTPPPAYEELNEGITVPKDFQDKTKNVGIGYRMLGKIIGCPFRKDIGKNKNKRPYSPGEGLLRFPVKQYTMEDYENDRRSK